MVHILKYLHSIIFLQYSSVLQYNSYTMSPCQIQNANIKFRNSTSHLRCFKYLCRTFQLYSYYNTASLQPPYGWHFCLCQSYFVFFFKLYSWNNLISSSTPVQKKCHLWFVKIVMFVSFQLEHILNCKDTDLSSPPILHQLSSLTFPRGQVKVSAICPD